MPRYWPVCLTLLTFACTEHHDSRSAQASDRGSGRGSAPGSNSDASIASPGTDAARPAAVPDAHEPPASPASSSDASGCPMAGDAQPDFALRLVASSMSQAVWGSRPTDDRYAGDVVVTASAARQLDLMGSDGTKASFAGAVPALPTGAKLWASFEESASRPNPLAYVETYTDSLRVRAQGAWIAERYSGFINPVSIVGARVDVKPSCMTSSRCWTTTDFAVTIHGDTDLTLMPGTKGQLTIARVAYEVTIQQAMDVAYAADIPSCTPGDYARQPVITLAARVLQYQDVLPGPIDGDRDAGAGP
jgi:hypothetical protein